MDRGVGRAKRTVTGFVEQWWDRKGPACEWVVVMVEVRDVAERWHKKLSSQTLDKPSSSYSLRVCVCVCVFSCSCMYACTVCVCVCVCVCTFSKICLPPPQN